IGLDTEALWRDTLERVGRLGVSPEAREHVTWFLRFERPELFALRSVVQDGGKDDSDLSWDVDVVADIERVRTLCVALGLERSFLPFEEVVAYHRQHGISDPSSA